MKELQIKDTMTKEQLEQELAEARAEYDLHVKSRPTLHHEYQHHCKVQQCLQEAEEAQQKLYSVGLWSSKAEAIEDIRIDLWNQFEDIRLLVQERSVLISRIAQIKKQLEPFLDKNSNNS